MLTRGRVAVLLAALLAVAAPAHAIRLGFNVVTTTGEAVENAEVCAFPSGGRDPILQWFSSGDVRCFPSSQVLVFPPGRWNFYAVKPGAFASRHPYGVIVRGEDEAADSGYKEITITVVQARTVRLAAGDDRSRLVLYFPGTRTTLPFARPVAESAESVTIPAELPYIPIRVEANRPAHAGALVAPSDVPTVIAVPPRPANGSRDLFAYVRVMPPPDGFEGTASSELPPPVLRLVAGDRSHAPLTALARTYDGELVIFRGAGNGRVVVKGALWEKTEQAVQPDGTPIELRPAAAVTIATSGAVTRWLADLGDDRCRSTARPHAGVAIELAACTGDDCSTAVRRLEPGADSEVESLRPGRYELRVLAGKKAMWRTAADLRSGRQDVRLEPPLVSLAGRVTRARAGVRARITLGRDTSVTDDAGRYLIHFIARRHGGEMRVVECDHPAEFVAFPSQDLDTIGTYDVELPPALNVRITDSESGKGVGAAHVIVRVPDPADAAMLRLNAPLPPTDDLGRTTAAATPLQPFYVCASADDYEENCSRPVERAASEPIELALRPAKTRLGRIVTQGLLSSAFLVRLSAAGEVIESAAVGADGEFRLKTPVTTVEHAVVVSGSHPLFLRRLAPEDSLIIELPAAARRSASVTLRSGTDAEIGVSIGGVMIPHSVLSRHQAFRGRSAFTSAGRLDIADLPAGAPIVIYRGFGRGERPPSLPPYADPFLLPEYRAAFPQMPLSADGIADFD